jgi:NAD(P)H dehydrogenase (quinone)
VRVLVVLAHPNRDSFNAALCREFCQGLHDAGHEPDVANLYADDFDPRLGARELDRMGSVEPEPAVEAYQKRVLAAQGLAFLFPVWWFGPPAILKGFVDRVFQENFAFRFTAGGLVEGLLLHRKALVLNTTGTGAFPYRAFGFDKPLQKTFCEWTLKFCGVKEVKHLLLHDVVKTDAATRRGYLDQAGTLGREFFG